MAAKQGICVLDEVGLHVRTHCQCCFMPVQGRGAHDFASNSFTAEKPRPAVSELLSSHNYSIMCEGFVCTFEELHVSNARHRGTACGITLNNSCKCNMLWQRAACANGVPELVLH